MFSRKIYSKITGKSEIIYMEFVITTKCTLKCRDCANLMQYYEQPYNIPVEKLIGYFDKLLNVFDYIYILNVLGGEPFIHPQLSLFLSHICSSPKIGEIRLVTNGTLIPDEETLSVLCGNKKIVVYISDYRAASDKKAELEEIFNKYKIRHRILFSDEDWVDYGNMRARGRSSKELKEIFSGCRTPLCQSYLNGEFHFCPRSSAGTDLGIVPRKEADYVDIGKLDSKEARRQMKRFLKRTRFVQACDYCNQSHSLPLKIAEPGIQMEG